MRVRVYVTRQIKCNLKNIGATEKYAQNTMSKNPKNFYKKLVTVTIHISLLWIRIENIIGPSR